MPLTDQEIWTAQVDSFYNFVIKTPSCSSPVAKRVIKRLTVGQLLLTLICFLIKIMYQTVLIDETDIVATGRTPTLLLVSS